MKEYLTYQEKSILFAAIRREKEVCKEVDAEHSEKKLERVCDSLSDHFMYDRLIKRVYADGIQEGKVQALLELKKQFQEYCGAERHLIPEGIWEILDTHLNM